jgi:carbamoyl-phosphate synthase large subunit
MSIDISHDLFMLTALLDVVLLLAGGTAKALRDAGIPCEMVYKIHEGRPNPTDLMKNGEIALIMLTSTGGW